MPEQTNLGGSTTLLTGRNDAYAWDNFGNRLSTAGTTHNGDAANYTTNALNQYTQRTVPGVFDASAAAALGTTVTVNGSAVARHGEYFFKGYPLTNTATAVYTDLSVSDGTSSPPTPMTAFVAKTPEQFAYDNDGNMTATGEIDYCLYDAENRLIWAQTAVSAYTALPLGVPIDGWSYKYDYLGRRVSKITYTWSGTGWDFSSEQRFIYSGWNLLAEMNGGTGSITRNYYWGLDWSGTLAGAGGVGGLGLIVEDGITYLPMYDGNGNVMGLIKANTGTIEAAYEYDAFGNTIRETGDYATSNPFRFSTKYTDLETGLVYYGLRYYSPGMGRFINKDPIEEAGGLNLYGFCGNNGVNRTDYLGMDWDDEESRLQAHYEELAMHEAMMARVNAVYGQPGNWDYVGYGSSIAAEASAAWSDYSDSLNRMMAQSAYLNARDAARAAAAAAQNRQTSANTNPSVPANGRTTTTDHHGAKVTLAPLDIVATDVPIPIFIDWRSISSSGGRAAPNSGGGGNLALSVAGAALGGAADYAKGLLWTGPKGLVTGLYGLVTTNPVTTVNNLANGLGTLAGNLTYNTGATLSAAGNAMLKPENIGAGVFTAGTFLVPGALAGRTGASTSFFEGTSYTAKVLRQMEGGAGEFHSFPRSVEAFEGAGSVRTMTGGDGLVRQVLEIPGSYSGRDGAFQFIKNADGTINHRLFVPGGPP